MNSSPFCENCGMHFEKLGQLQNHKKKFCISSKYADIDSLQHEFKQTSQNKDLSMFGNIPVAMKGRKYDFDQQKQKISDIDQQYKKILKQINDQKNYKNKVQNDKQMAFRQLEALEKQQEEIVIQNKKNNLDQVIRRREQLLKEQEELQKQLKNYNVKKKQWEKSQVKVKEAQDFPFEQGKVAGKLSRQRNILEEKKRDIELKMRNKKRQYDKIQNQLDDADQIIPYSKPTQQQPKYHISRVIKYENKSNVSLYQPEESRTPSRKTPSLKSSIKTENSNKSSAYVSSVKTQSPYLKPTDFRGDDKVLKFNLNREGKSEEDKIIEGVMAQEYDDLKILSKLPKGSDLYHKKLRQYEELSQARHEAQQKAQKIRLDKMKRQFQFQKHIHQNQRQNAKWVDENRKALVTRQLQMLNYKAEEPYLPQQQFKQPSQFKIEEPKKQINELDQIQISNKQQSSQKMAPSNLNIGSNQGPSYSKIQSRPYQGVRRQSQNKKNNIGYKVSVLQLKNYPHKRAVKVKLILYEEFYHKNNPGMKHQFSTIYHDESSGSDRDPFNPNFRNKLDVNGAIAYNESFYITQNLQKIYDKNQLQMYILLIVAEKDEKKITNEPRPYCWYSFKITHFGQIKQGRFTFNLYGDEIIYPIPADMNKMKKRMQQEITIELQEIIVNDHVLQQISKKNEPIKPQTKKTVSSIKKSTIPQKSDRNQVISIQNNIFEQRQKTVSSGRNTKVALQNSLSQISKQKSKKTLSQAGKTMRDYPFNIKNIDKEKSFSLKEDYFCSNEKPTQFSQVSLKRPLNFDFAIAGLRTLPSYIGPIKIEVSFLDVDSMNVIGKQQCLAEVGTDLYNPLVNFTKKIRNQSKIPPSTMVFIRIIALSAIDYQIYCLGFTVFYLFMDNEGNPIISNKITNYLMASGYYQLPIFWGNIEPRYLQLRQLLEDYPPIPCASILIGILQNSSKISNPMPQYRQEVYNTILFPLDESEAHLFEEQYKRQPTDTNKLISGFLQYKGINKNYSGEQVNKYLFKTLVFNRQNTKNLLKLNWMAEYNEFFGISFIIDKLTIPSMTNSLKYYYYVTTCLVPPALYYKEKGYDLNLSRKINLDNSTINQLLFDDNEFYFNPANNKNVSLLIEVNRIQILDEESIQSDNIESVAYTIIPLFTMGDVPISANVQRTDLKLISGDFDANTIDKLENGLSWYMNKIQNQPKSNITLSFRILNGYFMNQYEAKPLKSSKQALYKAIAPSFQALDITLQEIAKILSNNYNLQIS